MEQFMWLLVVKEQALHNLQPSKPNGVSLETTTMDSKNLQHLTIQTCCLSTGRAAMEKFTNLLESPGITGTSWPTLWIVAQV